ncbi:MAG: Eco57I restriction-modification methylase domain-containing protein [Caldilineaceae bacterium]
MPQAQPPLLLAQRHYNHQLFADRYLDVTLPGRTAWRGLLDEARPVLDRIQAIFAGYTPSTNEAQTEHELVRPVLEALGHSFEVQVALRTPRGVKRPDFVFYRSAAARAANKNKTVDESDLSQAFAVGDAKYWERRLDVSVPGEQAEINRIPAEQIAYYILHSGVTWGILTNGRRWRLYHKDTAQKQDRFYEVDLKTLCDAGDLEAFLYFYAFFRRAAFEPQPPTGVGGGLELTLASMLAESADYARGVSESLKVQVFDALRHLAQGFLDYGPNNLALEPPVLAEIYANSLTVLYRLLFVLYAEARELLPLRTSTAYREEYSLYAIVREAARRLDAGIPLLNDSTRTWAKLKDLFHIIDAGSPQLQVATFDGGLFDPARHPFLERHTVGDAHLQLALDQLARVRGEFIDYRDLAERHLGTIYEGLLEHHLDLLTAPVQGQRLMWTVDLFNDKGERHRTGSYYTPDYIVQYIVDQALRPVLDEAVAGATSDAEKIDAIFAVNVVDPSMGSGHFLVASTDYIAHYLVDLGLSPGEAAAGEADLAYWRRRAAQSCVYGVDINPLAVELAKLSLWLATTAKDRPLSFLDHHLRCGNALVGTQVAALDQELPQMGRGSSKPGARRKADSTKMAGAAHAAQEDGQLSLLSDSGFAGAVSTAVDSMWLIERNAGETVADVKQQEQLYEEVRRRLVARYAMFADLKTAEAMGAAVDRSLWKPLAEYALRREKGAFATPLYDKPLTALSAMAASERFFHWDLEFPEVFFDRLGRQRGADAGFDVVIGNPPYVRAEQVGELKGYLAATYPSTYHGTADLYVYFYEQGLRLLRSGGRLSYIVTNKWLRAGYGEGLRQRFAERALVERIVDFGHAPIFADADVFPCIIVLRKPGEGEQVGDQQVQVTAFPRAELNSASIDVFIAANTHLVPQTRFGRAAWSLETSDVDELWTKLRHAGVPLGEYTSTSAYRGVVTGFNKAFLIDSATRQQLIAKEPHASEIIKPYLRGQDIKRWSPEWDDLWMIFTRRGIDIDHYPGVKSYLSEFRPYLEPQPPTWTEGEWQGRKSGTYQWYEIQDSVDYWPLFNGPKLLYQEIQFHSAFAYDDAGYFTNNKVFILPGQDLYLLAILNSPLMWWHNWRYLPHMKDEALNPAGFLFEQLPIAIATDQVREECHLLVSRLITLSREGAQIRQIAVDWLRMEFGIDNPGQKLQDLAGLSADEYVAEVQKRRPKASGKLTPNALKALRAGFVEQATPLTAQRQEAQGLERRLAELVNAAYGLTPEEVELLWRTAPPRMPVGRP